MGARRRHHAHAVQRMLARVIGGPGLEGMVRRADAIAQPLFL